MWCNCTTRSFIYSFIPYTQTYCSCFLLVRLKLAQDHLLELLLLLSLGTLVLGAKLAVRLQEKALHCLLVLLAVGVDFGRQKTAQLAKFLAHPVTVLVGNSVENKCWIPYGCLSPRGDPWTILYCSIVCRKLQFSRRYPTFLVLGSRFPHKKKVPVSLFRIDCTPFSFLTMNHSQSDTSL